MKRMWSKNELKSIIQNQASSGDLENVKVFEDIVDKNGHKRFVDFALTTETIEGVEFTYAKASLSGSHLLMVLCGSVLNTTVITTGNFASIKLPEWIANKIVPIFSNIVSQQSYLLYNDDGTSQTGNIRLQKDTVDTSLIIIRNIGSTTLSKDRSFRIAFDLLIDNE